MISSETFITGYIYIYSHRLNYCFGKLFQGYELEDVFGKPIGPLVCIVLKKSCNKVTKEVQFLLEEINACY